MKKLLFQSIISFFFFSTVSFAMAESHIGNLKYYEKANPYNDVQAAIAMGDLRFIALMGYAMYVPGVKNYHEEYSSYGSKVIDGTSDNIQDYEHGRLIRIAHYYAENYNLQLLEHIDEIKSKKLAENLIGYENVKHKFEFSNVGLGNISSLPFSFYAALSLKEPSCVELARWYNPFKNDEPIYDWNQFLDIFHQIDQIVCEHHWIKKWIDAGVNRKAEARIYGIRPYTETLFQLYVETPWGKAGLSSEPYYEVNLREDNKWVGRLFISKDKGTAMVTIFHGANGSHWLDNKEFMYHATRPTFIVVDKFGLWQTMKN